MPERLTVAPRHGFKSFLDFPLALDLDRLDAQVAILGLPYGDQTLLVSKQLYTKAGGYTDMPLMEDVALVRKLSGHLTALPITATTGAARYLKDGWFTRSRKNLGTLALYFLCVSPENLAKRYER